MSDWNEKDSAIWKLSRDFIISIYKVTNEGYFDSEPILRNQIRGTALSVMNNVSSAFGAKKTEGKLFYLDRVREACIRLANLILLAGDFEAFSQDVVKELTTECEDLGSQAGKLAVTFAKKRKENNSETRKKQ